MVYFSMVQVQGNNLEIVGLYDDTIRQRDNGTYDADALVIVEGRRRIYRINFRRGPCQQIQIINAVDRNNIAQQNIQDQGRDNLRHNIYLNGWLVIYNILKFIAFVIPFGLFYPVTGKNCSYFSAGIGYLLLISLGLDIFYFFTLYFNIRNDPNWRITHGLLRINRLSWWINFTSLILGLTYLFGEPECGDRYESFVNAYVYINLIENVLPLIFFCCAIPIIMIFGRYLPSGNPLDNTRLDALPIYKFDPTIVPARGNTYKVEGDKIGFENEEEAEDAIDLTSYQEGDEVRLLRCKHHFKKETIDEWLRNQSQECPICRHNQNEPHSSEATSVV